MSESIMIALANIDSNPYQPRTSEDPEHVANLAASILRDGLLQEPIGREVVGRIQLAFGHSRLAAYRQLAKDGHREFGFMPVVIRELNDQQMFEMAIAENVARKNLSPIEEAQAMQHYRDDFGKSSVEIGELFGISDSTVRNKLRLLDLPETAQENLKEGQLGEASARRLLTLQRVRPEKVTEVAQKVIEEDLTPKETETRIANELRRDKNARRMWTSWMGKDPLGGYGLWPLDWEAPNGIIACTACDQHVKIDGGEHFCCDKKCWRQKGKEWRRIELTRLANELGIYAYSKKVDGDVFIEPNWVNSNDFDKWFEEKDAGLRLRVKYQEGSEHEFTHSNVVQLISVNAKALAKKQANAEKQENDSYVAQQNRREESRAFILAVSKYFVHLIGKPSSEIIDDLIDMQKNRVYGYAVGDSPEDVSEKVVYYQKLVVINMLDRLISYNEMTNGLATIAEKIYDMAVNKWGVFIEDWAELVAQYAEDNNGSN